MRIKVKEKGIIILYEVVKCEVNVSYDNITLQPYPALKFWCANNDFGNIKIKKETGLALQEELFKNGYLDLTEYNW